MPMCLIRNQIEYDHLDDFLQQLKQAKDENWMFNCKNPFILNILVRRIGHQLEYNKSELERKNITFETTVDFLVQFLGLAMAKHEYQLHPAILATTDSSYTNEAIYDLLDFLFYFYEFQETKNENGDIICTCSLNKEIANHIKTFESQLFVDYKQFDLEN